MSLAVDSTPDNIVKLLVSSLYYCKDNDSVKVLTKIISDCSEVIETLQSISFQSNAFYKVSRAFLLMCLNRLFEIFLLIYKNRIQKLIHLF